MNVRGLMAFTVSPLAWRSVAAMTAALLVAAELTAPQPLLPELLPRSGAAPLEKLAQKPTTASSRAVTYAAIAEHPLFYPSRQPWIAPPPPSVGKKTTSQTRPAPLGNYTLVGIVISDSNRSALLKSSNPPRTIILSEGQTIDGWTLREISHERLHFDAGDSTYDMSFPRLPKPGR